MVTFTEVLQWIAAALYVAMLSTFIVGVLRDQSKLIRWGLWLAIPTCIIGGWATTRLGL